MKRKISFVVILAMLISSLSACAEENKAVTSTAEVTAYAEFTAEYTDRDCDPSYDNEMVIDLTNGPVNITEAGVYVLTGTLNGGSVTVNVPDTDKVQLVLRNASITSADGPAINIVQCDKAFITLEGESTIADSSTYTLAEGETEPDAAVYSKNDVTFNGSGTLNVSGNYKHGIASKDDIKITGGTINITSVEDGLKGKDSVLIKDGSLNITAGTDGIQSSNTSGEEKGRISIDGGSVSIVCSNDGIQAESVLQVNGGTLNITAGEEADTEIKTDAAMGGNMKQSGDTSQDIQLGDMGNGGRGGNRGGMRPGQDGQMPQGDMPGGNRGGMRPGQDGQISEGMTMPEGTPPAMPGDRQMPQDGMPGSNRGGMQPGQNGQPGDMGGGNRGGMTDDDVNEEAENSVSIKGLKSANALYINGGTVTVSAEDDAIHANAALTVNGGTLKLRSADDGIHADYTTTINDGNITVERSYEGIEGKTVIINGGDIDVKAEDDGINASNPTSSSSMPGRGDSSVYIEINGGTLNVVSKVDSLDANGDIRINGGNVTVDGPSSGMECAIDCDGAAYVNGGEVAVSGVSTSSTTFNAESEQGSITVLFNSRVDAGTEIALYDADGNKINSITPTQATGGVVFSSEKLKKGKTYTVKADSISVDVELSELRMVVSETGEAVSGGQSGGGMGGDRGGKGGRKVSFNDVSDDAWYSQYVNQATSMGIMEGRDGSFMPETITTRAEYVTALYKAAGSPAVEGVSDFDDVSPDSEYAAAVAWAQSNGITTGDGKGNFMPEKSLTREMSMTFLYRALGSLNIASAEVSGDVLSGFNDKEAVSDWAAEAMNALVNMGIINGTDEGNLNPQGELNNAEVATMVCRAMDKRSDGMKRA